MTMKKLTVFALMAAAAAGAAAYVLAKKRQDEACCRYDADEFDDDDCFCEDCGVCDDAAEDAA